MVEAVGAEFTRLRQPEGLALWKLLQLPPKGLWSVPYLLSQGLLGLLGGAERPVQSLLSETTTAYSEVTRRNQLWVDLALKDAPGRAVADFE